MSRKADAGTLALILFAVLFFFADFLFLGKSFYIRDVARIYYPERKILRDILLSCELPLWNPAYAAGQPLAANPTAEAFYPLQWLVALPDFQEGVALEIVIHFLLGAAGMFVLLRSLGFSRTACAFGSVTFGLSGLLLSLASLLPCLFAIVWLPWLAFAVHRLVERRRGADFALAALFLGIILLIGEPSTILQSGALASVYIIVRWRSLRGIGVAAALCGTALLVGGAQIIPAIDHKRDSGRAAGIPYSEVVMHSMRPARVLELIAPNLFGRFTANAIYFWGSEDPVKIPWLFSWYAGLLAAALIIAGFIARIRGWTFAAAVTIISYLVALGRYGPVFPLLYRAGLRFIRYPEKWFMTASFVLIIFAASAADHFLRDAHFRRITFFVTVALAGVEACALAFVYSPFFARVFDLSGYFEDILREARAGAMTTLAISVALSLILVFRDQPRLVIPLLGAFVLVDLGPRVYGLAPRIDRRFYEPPLIAREVPPGARIYNDADWRLRLLPQPTIADRDRWVRMRNAMLPEMQSLWGFQSVLELDVTETLLLPTIEFSHVFWAAQLGRRGDIVPILLTMTGATHVAELRAGASPDRPIRMVTLPANRRFYFADQMANGSLMQLFDHRFSPHVAISDLPPFRPAAGRILKAIEQPNAIDLDVEATGNALLVVAVTRHKYWKGFLDGMPSPLHPANAAFQCMVIPPGRHHVALRYRNPLVEIFGLVSIVSALLLVVFALRNRALPPPSQH